MPLLYPIGISSNRLKQEFDYRRPNTYNNLCAWRHNMPLPLQVDNIFAFIRQVAPVPACWLFKISATSWPFDLESGVRVTCDVGYLCANFSLPRPLCSRLRPDVRDRRQTVRRASSLNASALWGRGIINQPSLGGLQRDCNAWPVRRNGDSSTPCAYPRGITSDNRLIQFDKVSKVSKVKCRFV